MAFFLSEMILFQDMKIVQHESWSKFSKKQEFTSSNLVQIFISSKQGELYKYKQAEIYPYILTTI